MNKFTQLLFIILILSGCNEPKKDTNLDIQTSISQLKELNNSLLPISTSSSGDVILPFTEEYLLKRNELYLAFQSMADPKKLVSHTELNYLIIGQRFPERYFPWPSQTNVVINVLNDFEAINPHKIKVVKKWIANIESKLIEAKNSKLKLDKIAHKNLLEQIQSSKIFVEKIVIQHEKNNALVSLNELLMVLDKLHLYIKSYKPRNMLGLHQIPNGKDWYQAKLNYFLSATDAPSAWLGKIQNKLKALNVSKKVGFTNELSEKCKSDLISSGYILPLTMLKALSSTFNGKLISEKVNGLDWQQGYINYPKTYEKLYRDKTELSTSYQIFILTLAEIDLGIHYQGWGAEQAILVLNTRIALDSNQTSALIEYIMFHPGQIMAGTKKLLSL
ncbi:hypothetical protein [Pseudoalteromonas denitrificans]|uniref:Uncharacterized protein n=1 Tax=Pseudoalteromonas denitrificans DSM 6059 TaxID=1123010 RepID=A0A1I1I014_9GAMM|nr:hypothetical protein [Pseudoalteromonas denitrificans]SFC29441.1 hypothetical protein SAMN02745724_01321 [Pseudoalteromonas denitrificans DSM 6059]